MVGKRNANNKLERREIAIIKKFIATTGLNDQEILAYFTRPSRTINHRAIGEIRNGKKHVAVQASPQEELDVFLDSWPNVDFASGLHIKDDELLIKSREAMLNAVQGYNNPRACFKSELFIVTAVIAFTYLLHWRYKKSGIDIRYKKNGTDEFLKTKYGAFKHWELDACLAEATCPLDEPTKVNLSFLIEIRHEIEHQLTTRIDDTISAKLQACCLNFNRAIKELAGKQYGLDRELNFSLQFSAIERQQRDILLKETGIPAHIQTAQTTFEDALADEMIRNPHYSYRVAYIEQAVNSRGKADQVVEFIKADTERGEKLQVVLKETERPKVKPAQIVKEMKEAGFKRFNIHAHTVLWQANDAKANGKNYGVKLPDGNWYWYPIWIDFVRNYLEEHKAEFD